MTPEEALILIGLAGAAAAAAAAAAGARSAEDEPKAIPVRGDRPRVGRPSDGRSRWGRD